MPNKTGYLFSETPFILQLFANPWSTSWFIIKKLLKYHLKCVRSVSVHSLRFIESSSFYFFWQVENKELTVCKEEAEKTPPPRSKYFSPPRNTCAMHACTKDGERGFFTMILCVSWNSTNQIHRIHLGGKGHGKIWTSSLAQRSIASVYQTFVLNASKNERR